jgi:hypothetical protein
MLPGAKEPNVTSAASRIESEDARFDHLRTSDHDALGPLDRMMLSEDDVFWLGGMTDIETFANGGTTGTTTSDLDALLGDAFLLDTADGEMFDWAQWDASFGDVQFVPPTKV